MKKSISIVCLFLLTSLLFAGGSQENETVPAEAAESSEAAADAAVEEKILNIYCYDSFASEWGPGPALAENFTAATGIEVNLMAPGDAVTVLSKVILEKENPAGDLLIGPDNNLLARVLAEDVLEPYNAPALAGIADELKFDDTNSLLPFDWGYFAICYDSEVLSNPPASLEDLTKGEYAKSLVLMDPRTSSPGMGFLLWTRAVYGEDYLEYWNRLAPSVLTVTESWSNGYGLFTSGEAPLVLSYSTSPVYHKMWEETDRFKALEFKEGNYLQVEGAGVIKGAAHPEAARQFIDYMLSEEGQAIIAVNNIMMPAVGATQLPEAFDMAFISEKPLLLDKEEIAAGEKDWVQSWVEKSGL
ncbi:MAG: thiamine ABC transporter substrate binding subunit [Spirochaetales bacterium]|nr:thiamine ABC transporter substrate binding subunit [Spirochaetales bacterium]